MPSETRGAFSLSSGRNENVTRMFVNFNVTFANQALPVVRALPFLIRELQSGATQKKITLSLRVAATSFAVSSKRRHPSGRHARVPRISENSPGRNEITPWEIHSRVAITIRIKVSHSRRAIARRGIFICVSRALYMCAL